METEDKRWYQILAHGVGVPNKKGKQKYESETLNVDGEYVVFDDIKKIRAFIDSINIFISITGRILGKVLPFVILEIQSILPKMYAEVTTEEWYIFDSTKSIYKNVGMMSISEAIDIYNNFNKQ